MAIRVLLLALLAALPLAVRAQDRIEETRFATVPCPVVAWTYDEPTVAPLPGARLFTGRYDGGLYVIEVPDDWNGELALWAHGNVNPESRGGSALRVQIPPLRAHWIRSGFAWAASSYRCNGSISGAALQDTMALRDIVERVGGRAPSRVYLNGVSLGGRVVIMGLREYPAQFDGGFAQCSMGQETNDFRVAIAAAAELLTGVRGSAGTINQDLARMREILGTPPNYTEKGRQLASIQVEMSGGPRPFAMEGLAARFIDNIRFGITNAPDAIVRAGTNVGMTYLIGDGLGLSPATLNARVPRRPPEGLLRSRSGPYLETVPFDGNLTRPLMSIQGTGDLQVPVAQQQALKREMMNAGKDALLVQRLMRIPGHCQFSEAEQASAFDDLVTWVRTGVRPEGDDVMGDLRNAGLRFTQPRRVGDPGIITLPPR